MPARRARTGLTPFVYPLHDWTSTVTHCARISYKSRKINLSQVFAGQDVGVKQVSDRIWLVTFMTTISAASTTRPAGSSRSRTPSGRKCYRCARNKTPPMRPEWTPVEGSGCRDLNFGRGDWIRTCWRAAEQRVA